jgi:hypothetical protein
VTADDGARGWASRRRGCWGSPPPPLDPARDSAAWRGSPFGESKSESNESNSDSVPADWSALCKGRPLTIYSGTKPWVGGCAGPGTSIGSSRHVCGFVTRLISIPSVSGWGHLLFLPVYFTPRFCYSQPIRALVVYATFRTWTIDRGTSCVGKISALRVGN